MTTGKGNLITMQPQLFMAQQAVSRPSDFDPTVLLKGRTWSVTPVFEAYWRFAAERHAIFSRRLAGTYPFTSDPILSKFKFTNAFRVLDRTSQYLLREVVRQPQLSEADIFFRILLFKLFNKIETWELLREYLGEPRLDSYNFAEYDRVLSKALQEGKRIYSAAYIMPSGGPKGEERKHRSHLRLLELMLADGVPSQLASCANMQKGFAVLRSYPMVGNFLAYQFITDLNYSWLTAFSEMEFVVPGPGALDGLRKCFPNMVPPEAAELIRAVCENQDDLQEQFGLSPIRLQGRPLQLIDCQNLFCETDKYARVAYPDVVGFSGRTRIKQAFRITGAIASPVFPEKWKMDDKAC